MYGYLGCKFRTRITAEPVYPKPGESFSLKAYLTINPATPATEGMEVEFFKLVDKTEESLGKNLTDADGIAVLSHAEPAEGTYQYLARYTLENTYAEIKTVKVTKAPPVCPIEISATGEMCPITEATQGTIVFTQLDTIRWYRDNCLPRSLVKMYYWLTPVTGRVAKYSRTARFIIRGLTKISIKAIEKRYGDVVG
jgi:5-hydroxyisourate hydrolase-like protein (transthyretin family)